MSYNRPALYSDVVLTRDLDEYGLKKGDVAAFIDTVPHPSGGPEGLILEVANAPDDSLGIVTVTDGDIRPLEPNEVITVRRQTRTHYRGAS